MKYLFDASAVVNLVKRRILVPFAEGAVLSLTPYECLNAVWKESALLGRLDGETAKAFAEILIELFKLVETLDAPLMEAYELACREGMSVYDAAYVEVARERKLVLVTDDEKLARVASKYVKVLSSKAFEKRR